MTKFLSNIKNISITLGELFSSFAYSMQEKPLHSYEIEGKLKTALMRKLNSPNCSNPSIDEDVFQKLLFHLKALGLIQSEEQTNDWNQETEIVWYLMPKGERALYEMLERKSSARNLLHGQS